MFSATQLANFLACPHITTLERAEGAGEIRKPFFDDPGIDLLRALGLKHEQAYLNHLRDDQGLDVILIPQDLSWSRAAARTLQEMKRGAAAIYQATLIEAERHGRGGRADFLIRVDKPGAFGFWSYEVVETKLARSTRATAVIQLCFYSDLLSRIQGIVPELMHVVLGGTTIPEKFQFNRYAAYFRRVSRDFDEALDIRATTYPEPVDHCRICAWSVYCDAQWRLDDHLSLVAGITRNQRKALVERNICTVAGLAELAVPVTPRFERIGEKALHNIREQARIQVQGRIEGRMLHELLEPVEAGKGLLTLPVPSPGDMFLDFESDPFAFDQGLEYLTGIITASPNQEGTLIYDAVWSFDPAEEKTAFEGFIAKVMERWQRHPDMHIFHYAAYEVTAIKRLAGRHSTCTDEVDQLLRAGVFVDLFRVVRQSLRASVESYSIKKLEPLYEYKRAVPLRAADEAREALGGLFAFGDGRLISGEIRAEIEGYNRDDCVSALRLRDWLEKLRLELEAKTGHPLPRPVPEEKEPGKELGDHIKEVGAVKAALEADVPTDTTERSEEQQSRWLLAQLLDWHRREEKSAWWEYFRLCTLSGDELIEDRTALGGLVYIGEVGRVKKSVIHRYKFPPQEYKLDMDREVHDPATRNSAGKIVTIDDDNWTIDIKRGISSSVPHPAALIPRGIVGTRVLGQSLLRLGKWAITNGINQSGQFRSARDILLRLPPRVEQGNLLSVVGVSLTTLEAANRLVLSLDKSVLPIQGPPGSGKTFIGARMALELVKHGRRVGITGPSHKVISNLLSEVCRAAQEANITVPIVQKAEDAQGCQEPMVTLSDDNSAVLDALTDGTAQIAAGTPWLWAREEMAGKVDVLFVDEAGQMSLANVLAVSQAAASVVLLGDPQQLDQPQKGIHPPGADASALAHLLHGRPTIDEDRGLFLKDTWRLHPDVCALISELFYEGRLVSREENRNQRLNTRGFLDGTGLRFAPVEHEGNQSESPEEVDRLVELMTGLLKDHATWCDKNGRTLPLTLEDILIVAPYNAQVAALARKLPEGARVGTVDKFQGQEAPIVFYSMTTSTPEDAPRGMEFLYSLNRLNVAISRARCVAVIVASPALFSVQCNTPRQIELANALCRFLEMARSVC